MTIRASRTTHSQNPRTQKQRALILTHHLRKPTLQKLLQKLLRSPHLLQRALPLQDPVHRLLLLAISMLNVSQPLSPGKRAKSHRHAQPAHLQSVAVRSQHLAQRQPHLEVQSWPLATALLPQTPESQSRQTRLTSHLVWLPSRQVESTAKSREVVQ
jgi:hypothetical protein